MDKTKPLRALKRHTSLVGNTHLCCEWYLRFQAGAIGTEKSLLTLDVEKTEEQTRENLTLLFCPHRII